MSSETGQCRKCTSEIPVEAERCPECGYEPSVGALGRVGAAIAVMLGVTSLVIAFAALVAISQPGLTAGEGLLAAGLFGLIGAGLVGYYRRKTDAMRKKPVPEAEDEPGFWGDVIGEWKEAWEEAQDR